MKKKRREGNVVVLKGLHLAIKYWLGGGEKWSRSRRTGNLQPQGDNRPKGKKGVESRTEPGA